MAMDRTFFVSELEKKENTRHVFSKLVIDKFVEAFGERVEIKRTNIKINIFWCVAFALAEKKSVRVLDLSGMLNSVESRDRAGQAERFTIVLKILRTARSLHHLLLNRSEIPKGKTALLVDALKKSSLVSLTMNECWFEDVNELDELTTALEGNLTILNVSVVGSKQTDRNVKRSSLSAQDDFEDFGEDFKVEVLLKDVSDSSLEKTAVIAKKVEKRPIDISSLTDNRYGKFGMPKQVMLSQESKALEKTASLKK